MIHRNFQQQARQEINRHLNAGRNPVFVSPTGTGKTYTACQVISDRVGLKERIFILTPQDEIFKQWCLELYKHTIDYGTINSKGVQGKNKKVYVCMPLSLNNILSVLPEYFKPNVIITDECHHSAADTWKNIYAYYDKALNLGLTATPQRTDGQGIDDIYNCIVSTIEMNEAIKKSYLAKPLLIVPEQYKLKVNIQNGDYNPEEQAQQLGKTKIIGDVIKRYTDIFSGLPVIVSCSTHEHAKMMTEKFCDAGWKFEHIHSKLSEYDRSQMIKNIKTEKLNGLCTVGIGIEGMDIPGLYGLIWLRRTLSLTIYLQLIGRVLRASPGKEYGIIIDPVGNAFIHGSPELPREWSLQGKNKNTESIPAPKMKICPNCCVMNSQQNIFCHICKHDFRIESPDIKKRKIPKMVNGELVLLDESEIEIETDLIFQKLKLQKEDEAIRAEQKKEKELKKELTKTDKLKILKTGLELKKNSFSNAVEKYL